MSTVTRVRKKSLAGFTLIELLIVVAIIGITAALSLPAIARYIRNYRVNGGATSVQGGLQQARLKAITGNVNYGTLFVVIDADTFQVVSEDLPPNQTGFPFQPVSGGRLLVSQLLAAPLAAVQAGTAQDLPRDVVFADGGNGCPDLVAQGFAFDPGTVAVRFNRLGAACRPNGAAEPCPQLDTGAPFFWRDAGTNDLALCIRELRTGVTRGVVVSPSGRVAAAPVGP
jgi:prepilin-type N-terminal cleavage/methylation domain-containing protein